VKLEQGKSQIWSKQNVNLALKMRGTTRKPRRIRAKTKQERRAIYCGCNSNDESEVVVLKYYQVNSFSGLATMAEKCKAIE